MIQEIVKNYIHGYCIITRPKRWVLVSAAYCRSGRGCACEYRR